VPDIYKGLTIQFGADTKGLSAALRDISKESRGITSELRKVENALKFNPGNTELIRQRQELLGKQINTTKTRLDALRQAEAKLGKEDIGTTQYNNLQREIIETTSKLGHLEDKARDANTALKPPSKIGAAFRKIGSIAAAAIGAIAIGAAGAVAGMVALAKGAEEAQVADKRIDAIAKSMKLYGKNVEKVTDRLKDFATEQAGMTGVDDDIIKGAQAKLLTFKNLAKTADDMGGAFDRATQLTIDMAAAGFGTAEGNAVQLGKALENPIKGMAALNKSGITFTDAEKKKIGALVKSGKLLEAQDIILKTVEKQVGGTAKATAKASDKMAWSWGEVKEAAGTVLLPAFTDIAESVTTKVIPALDELIEEKGPAIEQAIKDMATSASNTAGTWREVFADPEVRAQLDLLKQSMDEFKTSTGETDALVSKQTWVSVLLTGLRSIGIQTEWAKTKTGLLHAGYEGLGGILQALASPFESQRKAFRDTGIQASKFSGYLNQTKDATVRLLAAMFKLTPEIQRVLSRAFQNVINSMIDSLNVAIRAYNKLPANDISQVPNIGFSSKGTQGTVGHIPQATGGSWAPNRPGLAMLGDQRGVYEHVLREDQIVSLMRTAMGGGKGGTQIVQNFQQPVQSYSETKRAVRDAMEAVAI